MASVSGFQGSARHAASSVARFIRSPITGGNPISEGNYSAGETLRHRIERTTFDLNWSYIYARGLVDYSAASPGALVYPSEFATMGAVSPQILIG